MTEPSKHNLPCDTEHSQVAVSDSKDKVSDSNVTTSDSKITSSDVEAQLDAVAELVARVRHEINNPLAGVLGQAQLLLREDLNDKARKRAETIESLAMRLRDIVGQLREVQRPKTETQP